MSSLLYTFEESNHVKQPGHLHLNWTKQGRAPGLKLCSQHPPPLPPDWLHLSHIFIQGTKRFILLPNFLHVSSWIQLYLTRLVLHQRHINCLYTGILFSEDAFSKSITGILLSNPRFKLYHYYKATEVLHHSEDMVRLRMAWSLIYQLSGSTSRGIGSPSLSLKSWLAFGSCNSYYIAKTNQQLIKRYINKFN